MNQNKKYVSTREAADLLNVSLRTVQLWSTSGVLHAWKTIGGHRRILRASVESILDQQQQVIDSAMSDQEFKLVIIEDDPKQQQLYKMTIKKYELPVTLFLCNNGYEGLLQIGRNQPDLIIVDLMMPEMNGFKMIESLQMNSDIAHGQILVISALGPEEIKARGGLPEEIKTLQKPIELDKLVELINTQLITKKNYLYAID